MTRAAEQGAGVLVAAAALAGLVVQTAALTGRLGSVVAAVAVMSAYFTILTNLVVAVAFAALALAGRSVATPRRLAFVMLSILLVGVVYVALLHGTADLAGGDAVANVLLHMVTPVLVPLAWLAVVPKGHLRVTDPLVWALYPLAYLVYALVRARATGLSPYPFMNVARFGVAQVALNAVLIGLGYLVAGLVVVALDRGLAPRRG